MPVFTAPGTPWPAAPAQAAAAWPAVREELLMHPAPAHHDGTPAWTLEDPGRALYFQIGWVQAEMLARWSLGDAHAIAAAMCEDTTLHIEAAEVAEFARFLQANGLLVSQGPQAIERLIAQAQAAKRSSWWRFFLQHYLFFRVPLLRPDAFLQRTLPWVQRLFLNRRFLLLSGGAGVLGLWLVARQWERFTHTFLYFYTLEGALLAALTLGLTKCLHELGHAYAVRYHGCRVATMGVAFMVMWPVLYTDTSGAWRLRSRWQRMGVGAAGMLSETVLAAWATLAWSFLPEGMLRSAAFMVATTTWLMTLAVNLNPFMRFDGYFLLSDALNVPNLQPRAFALARWKLREVLFALGDAPPEVFAPWRARLLCAYAMGVWVYRLVLFTGIALLVYHFSFKLLGIVLFAIEMGVFVLKPIAAELQVWWARLRQPRSAKANSHTGRAQREAPMRRAVVGLLLGLLVLLLIVPWRSQIEAPALMRALRQAPQMAPVAAQLVEHRVVAGQVVRKGETLFTLQSPELEQEMAMLRQRIRALEWQQSFLPMGRDTASGVPVAQRELQAAQERLVVLVRQQDALRMKAAFDGRMVDVANPLATGEWVRSGEWLGTLADTDEAVVEAYVSEAAVHRLQTGMVARFLAEDPNVAARAFTVQSIARTATRRLTAHPELVSSHGGGIAATQPPRTESEADLAGQVWVPEHPVYRVLLSPQGSQSKSMPRAQVLRGSVVIDGARESLLGAGVRRALGVLVRESGF